MVQAFRRTMNESSTKDLVLRGLHPTAKYEISDVDSQTTKTASGKDLMQQGLHVEIGARPGSCGLRL